VRADDIGDFQSKADSWISRAKDTYRVDCEGMSKIWEACGQYDETQEAD